MNRTLPVALRSPPHIAWLSYIILTWAPGSTRGSKCGSFTKVPPQAHRARLSIIILDMLDMARTVHKVTDQSHCHHCSVTAFTLIIKCRIYQNVTCDELTAQWLTSDSMTGQLLTCLWCVWHERQVPPEERKCASFTMVSPSPTILRFQITYCADYYPSCLLHSFSRSVLLCHFLLRQG